MHRMRRMSGRRPGDLPNLRLFEYAVALDQHRSFSRAAQGLGVTQPTFSRGIAALEKRLGARLFDRSSRHVEPTPEGELFLARAATLLADAVHLRDRLQEYQNLRSGRVTVGVGPYPLEISVIECVARMAARYPRLQIELVEGQWRKFGPKLLAGEVEIAVVEALILSADQRFDVEMLPTHDGCFYCRPKHPLAGRVGLGLAAVLDFPIVGVRMPARAFRPHRLPYDGLTLDPGTGDIVPQIVTTSITAARAIVKRTDGIGIGTPTLLAEDIQNGTLVLIDADSSTLRSNYGIGYLRDKILSPGALRFIETLKEVEAELAAPRAPTKVDPRGGRRRRTRDAQPRTRFPRD